MFQPRYSIIFISFFVLILLETFFPLFTGRRKKGRLIHGVRNLAMIAVNNAVIALFFAAVLTRTFGYIEEHRIGLFYWLELSPALRLVGVLVVFDFWMYIWHRLAHEVPFIMRFHRMHHSDPEMDVTTALRFHFGEIVLSTIARLPIFALLGMRAWELILYETIMLPIIFFHHSNFFLPESVDRILRIIIPTPWMHWVHHSMIPEERNSNYGTVLSVWDRLFGTFRLRPDPMNIEYGVPIYKESEWQTLWGMLKTPFAAGKCEAESTGSKIG